MHSHCTTVHIYLHHLTPQSFVLCCSSKPYMTKQQTVVIPLKNRKAKMSVMFIKHFLKCSLLFTNQHWYANDHTIIVQRIVLKSVVFTSDTQRRGQLPRNLPTPLTIASKHINKITYIHIYSKHPVDPKNFSTNGGIIVPSRRSAPSTRNWQCWGVASLSCSRMSRYTE